MLGINCFSFILYHIIRARMIIQCHSQLILPPLRAPSLSQPPTTKPIQDTGGYCVHSLHGTVLSRLGWVTRLYRVMTPRWESGRDCIFLGIVTFRLFSVLSKHAPLVFLCITGYKNRNSRSLITIPWYRYYRNVSSRALNCL